MIRSNKLVVSGGHRQRFNRSRPGIKQSLQFWFHVDFGCDDISQIGSGGLRIISLVTVATPSHCLRDTAPRIAEVPLYACGYSYNVILKPLKNLMDNLPP